MKAGGKRKLNEMEKSSLVKGRKIIEYLNKFGKPVFLVPGNWDQSYGKTRIKNMDKNDYNYLKSFYDFWLGDKMRVKILCIAIMLCVCGTTLFAQTETNSPLIPSKPNVYYAPFVRQTSDCRCIKTKPPPKKHCLR